MAHPQNDHEDQEYETSTGWGIFFIVFFLIMMIVMFVAVLTGNYHTP